MSTVPKEILTQHIAVLGKTGSGKTSTAKLAIEQVVADGARVCVLDPIKSDWWGLTSSRDGKRAGLPFHILGGPHGHVPLHASAGKAIAEIVANGALPLSIIDMADFEPGGQAKFFTDFAPTLLRKMRGVVYLVIEEAHLFAPKERSGIGAENLSIHWAKTLSTAGRSKGIRLVIATQRTQALHNAVLGSCDTLIAHRLTAPADQDPVVKWLKANTSKEVLEQVAGSLASLKTGEGWICSGEAKLFERVQFPRIKTYDNTATPTGEGETREIKTAPVDPEKLRAIIGEAVELAKADDPKELRREVARLKQALSMATGAQQSLVTQKTVEKPVLTDADRALLEKLASGIGNIRDFLNRAGMQLADEAERRFTFALQLFKKDADGDIAQMRAEFERRLDQKGFQKILDKLASIAPSTPLAGRRAEVPARARPVGRRALPVAGPNEQRSGGELRTSGDASIGNSGLRRMLIALAQRPQGLTRQQLGVRATLSSRSGTFDTYLSKARVQGWVADQGGRIVITDAGVAAIGPYDPLPEGADLLAHWLGQLGSSGAARILRTLADAYPRGLTRADLGAAANLSDRSGTFDTYLSKLRTLELIEGRGELRASEELFS